MNPKTEIFLAFATLAIVGAMCWYAVITAGGP